MNKWGTMAIAAIAGVTYYNSQDMSTELRVDENQRKFIEWVAVHGKSYPTREEHNMRLARFKNSIAEVARLNAEASQDGQDRAQYSLNKFSDWTADEYQALLGFQGGNGNEESVLEARGGKGGKDGGGGGGGGLPDNFPSSKDWTSEGAVNAIKD